MTKITYFYFENFNIYFKNFETVSPKLHPLTLNHKFRLVNSRKKYFYLLIKLILVIFFIDDYFCDKNLKIDILEIFSGYNYILSFDLDL